MMVQHVNNIILWKGEYRKRRMKIEFDKNCCCGVEYEEDDGAAPTGVGYYHDYYLLIQALNCL